MLNKSNVFTSRQFSANLCVCWFIYVVRLWVLRLQCKSLVFCFFFFFKLITLPCRLRVDNVLWFRFKNRWKSVFTTFDWCTASQLIWHTQSLTLSSVLSGNIGGYITFKSARKKTKKKLNEEWGQTRARLLLHSSWKSVGEKNPHNIADVLGCWPTLFWNYNVSTWWIITVIKMELSGESVRFLPQRRTNGSFFSLRHSEV